MTNGSRASLMPRDRPYLVDKVSHDREASSLLNVRMCALLQKYVYRANSPSIVYARQPAQKFLRRAEQLAH